MSAELAEDIAGLVDAILKPLVNYPDELSISSREEADTVYAEITLNPDDTGKVIGKNGKVIKSVRTLARAVASREGLNCEIEIIE